MRLGAARLSQEAACGVLLDQAIILMGAGRATITASAGRERRRPPATAADRRSLSTNAAAPAAPQLQPRISTGLTDVTQGWDRHILAAANNRAK